MKGTDKVFDIEVQTTDTKELPERARYYQGLMDLDSLKAGQKYKDLCDSHVIFICLKDIFHNKLPVSTFENICIEDGKTKLKDRAYKHFFFAKACAKMIDDEEVRSFFKFLISNRAGNGFTSDLKDYVTDAKHNIQWRHQFMTWERQRAYDFDDGKEVGMQEAKLEAARNFLAEGIVPEIIARCTGLPLEEVQKLAKETCVTKA